MAKRDQDDSLPEKNITGIFRSGKIIGPSPQIRAVLELANVAAAQSTLISVLLLGESGTGKGLLAREIHAASRRAHGPFVAFNCGAPNRNMIEEELFGHEKGAFTGAIARRPGVFEQASAGTLFLDEVADLPLDLQVKLFGVLDTRMVKRLGGTREIPIDARIISATNHDLEAAIAQGKFRAELYHRIDTFPITIPPLRERIEDILPLAAHFITRFSEGREQPISGPTSEVETLLQAYPWPGNVRELENVIARMVAITQRDWLTVAALPSKITQRSTEQQPQGHALRLRPGGLGLSQRDAQIILDALNRHNGNKSRAARELGITRGQLIYRLKLMERNEPK